MNPYTKNTVNLKMEREIERIPEAQQTPCPPGKKPRKESLQVQPSLGKVVAMRLSARAIKRWIQDHVDPFDATTWVKYTHVVYDCLMYKHDGGVCVDTYQPTKKDLQATCRVQTYVPFLKDLKMKFPHLKLIYALCPTMPMPVPAVETGLVSRHQGPLEGLISKYGWHQVFADVKSLPRFVDGVEFNFTAQRVLDGEFVNLVEDLKRSTVLQVWVAPPYEMEQLNDLAAQGLIRRLYQFVDYYVLYSFGYFKTTSSGRMKPCNDCSLEDFDKLCTWLLTDGRLFSLRKCLMFVDTLGVEYASYLPQEQCIEKFRMDSNNRLRQMMLAGKSVRLGPDDRLTNFDYIGEQQARSGFIATLNLTEMPMEYALDNFSMLSYESKMSLREKSKYIIDMNMGGAVVGELQHDSWIEQLLLDPLIQTEDWRNISSCS